MGAPALPKYDQLKHYGDTVSKIDEAIKYWLGTAIWIEPKSHSKDSTLGGLYHVRKAVQEACVKRNMPFVYATRTSVGGQSTYIIQIPRQKRTEKLIAYWILIADQIDARQPVSYRLAAKPHLRLTGAAAFIYVTDQQWQEMVNPFVAAANWRQVMRLT